MFIILSVTLFSVALCQSPIVQFDAWGNDSVRVRIAPAGGAIVEPPYTPLLLPHPSFPGGPSSGSALTNGNMRITNDASSGVITATRVSDGALLFSTKKISFAQAAIGSHKGWVSASLSLTLPGSNRLYGLGEHRQLGKLDATGFTEELSNSQYYPNSRGADIVIPFFSAMPLGLGFLWNLPSYGFVDLNVNGTHTWSSYATQNIDFWVSTTPASPPTPAPTFGDPAATSPLASLLRNYVDAVGHATPMPYYVTGFWACKNRYRDQQQLLDVVSGYKDRGLPLSIITIDYMHWRNFGDWSFDPSCWPDPEGMVSTLKAQDVELAVTFWPYVTPAGAYYNNFSAAGYFATNLTGAPMAVESWAGPMHLVDQFNPLVRSSVYAAFRENYGRIGIRTVWLDGSEPERGSQNFGAVRFSGGTDSELGEAWVQQHVRAMAEGFTGDGYKSDEFFLLPRSTWAGNSRYSAGVWSGDISSTFEELGIQVRVLQQVALSGQALWTNDGGGYAGGDVADPVFRELVVRWLQASAFFPIMRLHGQRKGGPPPNQCGKTGGDNG